MKYTQAAVVTAFAVTTVLTNLGCDSSAAPSEAFSDITGTYNASILFTNGSNAIVRGLQCTGTLVVASQDETSISGTLQKDAPCNQSVSFEGRVGSGGQISLNAANEGTATPFSPACTFAELETYHGSVLNGEIILSRPYAFSCSAAPSGSGSEVIGASKP